MLYHYTIFAHNKSSSTSPFIARKSRYLQKLTTALRIGTGAYAGWLASPSSPGYVGQSVVFPIIFLYTNDLPDEVLSSTPSITSL